MFPEAMSVTLEILTVARVEAAGGGGGGKYRNVSDGEILGS